MPGHHLLLCGGSWRFFPHEYIASHASLAEDWPFKHFYPVRRSQQLFFFSSPTLPYLTYLVLPCPSFFHPVPFSSDLPPPFLFPPFSLLFDWYHILEQAQSSRIPNVCHYLPDYITLRLALQQTRRCLTGRTSHNVGRRSASAFALSQWSISAFGTPLAASRNS